MSGGAGRPPGGDQVPTEVGASRGPRGFSLYVSIAVGWIGPVVAYWALRPLVRSDAATLAIASALPILRLGLLWFRRRRLDGFAAFATLALLVTVGLSLWLGGSALPIKLARPIITGTIGLALIGSALIGRPLLITLYRAVRKDAAITPPDPRRRRTVALLTGVLGLIFLADAVVHIALALRVGTLSYLLDSRAVTIVVVLLLLVLRFAFGRRRV